MGSLGILGTECRLGQGLYFLAMRHLDPTVWPQYTNVTDRTGLKQTDRQTDNGHIGLYSEFYISRES